MKPYSILKTEVGRKCGDTSSSVSTKIGDALNRKYNELWLLYPWVESVVINESFTIASGRVDQVLPGNIDIVYSISERSNDIVLKPVSPYVYDMKNLTDVDSSNQPINYTPAGSVSTSTKMSANATLKFVSDSASDTTQTIRIYSKNSSGIYVSEQISLNGTTAVATSNTYLAGWIENISKSALTVGTITVKDASDNVLGYIAPRDYTSRYLRINLQSPPDQAYTGYVSGKKPFKPMEYDEDVPVIDCCDALVHYATAEILRVRGKYGQAEYEIKEGDRLLAALVTNKEIMDEAREDTIPTIVVADIDRPAILG